MTRSTAWFGLLALLAVCEGKVTSYGGFGASRGESCQTMGSFESAMPCARGLVCVDSAGRPSNVGTCQFIIMASPVRFVAAGPESSALLEASKDLSALTALAGVPRVAEGQLCKIQGEVAEQVHCRQGLLCKPAPDSSNGMGICSEIAPKPSDAAATGQPCKISGEVDELVYCQEGLRCLDNHGNVAAESGVCQPGVPIAPIGMATAWTLAEGQKIGMTAGEGEYCLATGPVSAQVRCRPGLLCLNKPGDLNGPGHCSYYGRSQDNPGGRMDDPCSASGSQACAAGLVCVGLTGLPASTGRCGVAGVAPMLGGPENLVEIRPVGLHYAHEGQMCKVTGPVSSQIRCRPGLMCFNQPDDLNGPGTCSYFSGDGNGLGWGQPCASGRTCAVGLSCVSVSGKMAIRGRCGVPGESFVEEGVAASEEAESSEEQAAAISAGAASTDEELAGLLTAHAEISLYVGMNAEEGSYCLATGPAQYHVLCRPGLHCLNKPNDLNGPGTCSSWGYKNSDAHGYQSMGSACRLLGPHHTIRHCAPGLTCVGANGLPSATTGRCGTFNGRSAMHLSARPWKGAEEGAMCKTTGDPKFHVYCKAGLFCLSAAQSLSGHGICSRTGGAAPRFVALGQQCSMVGSSARPCAPGLLCLDESSNVPAEQGICGHGGLPSAERLAARVGASFDLASLRAESGSAGANLPTPTLHFDWRGLGERCNLPPTSKGFVHCRPGLSCLNPMGIVAIGNEVGHCSNGIHGHALSLSLASPNTLLTVSSKGGHCKMTGRIQDMRGCEPGLVCRNKDGMAGLEGTCEEIGAVSHGLQMAGLGEDCSTIGDPNDVVYCEAGLICTNDDGYVGTEGTCERPGSWLPIEPGEAQEGERCQLLGRSADIVECASGLSCQTPSGFLAPEGTCQRSEPGHDSWSSEGEECRLLGDDPTNLTLCEPGLVCRDDAGYLSWEGICRSPGGLAPRRPRVAGEGEACTMIGDPEELVYCEDDLVCSDTNGLLNSEGTCQRPNYLSGEGEPCKVWGHPSKLKWCVTGLACTDTDGFMASEGVCNRISGKAVPFEPSHSGNNSIYVGEGQDCKLYGAAEDLVYCELGLECQDDEGFLATNGRCQKMLQGPHFASESEECRLLASPKDLSYCEAGLVCMNDAGYLSSEGTCERMSDWWHNEKDDEDRVRGLVKEGEECRLLGRDDEIARCALGLVCVNSEGALALEGSCERLGQAATVPMPGSSSSSSSSSHGGGADSSVEEARAAAEGEDCKVIGESDDDELTFCEAGTVCLTKLGFLGAEGTCQKLLGTANINTSHIRVAGEMEECKLVGLAEELVYCEVGLLCLTPHGLLGGEGSCSRHNSFSRSSSMPTLAKAGESCRPFGNPREVKNCEFGLVCTPSWGNLRGAAGSGTCEQLGGGLVAVQSLAVAGQPCDLSGPDATKQVHCGSGLRCMANGYPSLTGTCRPQAQQVGAIVAASAGRTCYMPGLGSDNQHPEVVCEAGLHCLVNDIRDPIGICVDRSHLRTADLQKFFRVVGAGQECKQTVSPRYQIHCASGLVCVTPPRLGASGVCRARSEMGVPIRAGMEITEASMWKIGMSRTVEPPSTQGQFSDWGEHCNELPVPVGYRRLCSPGLVCRHLPGQMGEGTCLHFGEEPWKVGEGEECFPGEMGEAPVNCEEPLVCVAPALPGLPSICISPPSPDGDDELEGNETSDMDEGHDDDNEEDTLEYYSDHQLLGALASVAGDVFSDDIAIAGGGNSSSDEDDEEPPAFRPPATPFPPQKGPLLPPLPPRPTISPPPRDPEQTIPGPPDFGPLPQPMPSPASGSDEVAPLADEGDPCNESGFIGSEVRCKHGLLCMVESDRIGAAGVCRQPIDTVNPPNEA